MTKGIINLSSLNKFSNFQFSQHPELIKKKKKTRKEKKKTGSNLTLRTVCKYENKTGLYLHFKKRFMKYVYSYTEKYNSISQFTLPKTSPCSYKQG